MSVARTVLLALLWVSAACDYNNDGPPLDEPEAGARPEMAEDAGRTPSIDSGMVTLDATAPLDAKLPPMRDSGLSSR